MVPINAIYVRMRELLNELGILSVCMTCEVTDLKERLAGIGISWSGTAYEAYSRRLIRDLDTMENTSKGIAVMCTLLYISLSRYQETELKVADIIGGLGR